MSTESYLPALKCQTCIFLYDFICSFSRLGVPFKIAVLEAAHLQGHERIADIGCGTGVMLSLFAKRFPQSAAYGLDPDPAALSYAQRRVCAGNIALQQGYAQRIPQPSNSFDVVFCTLTLHHLPDADKKTALGEMFRILKPGGRLYVTDLYQGNWWPGLFLFEKRAYIRSCLKGAMPQFLKDAGFVSVSSAPFRRFFLSMTIGCKPL